MLLNRRPYLSGEDQRREGRTFITAFLEASLRDANVYRALFRNPAAGRAWLPDDVIVTTWHEAGYTPLNVGAESGATVEDAGFTMSRVTPLNLRDAHLQATPRCGLRGRPA